MAQEDVTPYYQSGVAGVKHRNIDSAGDGHPFGDEPKEWEADLRPLIRQVADDLYDSWEATVREYLANAETACLKVNAFLDDPAASPYDDMIVDDSYEPRIVVTWDRSKQKLIIKDNGIGMAAVEVDEVFRHIGRSAARDLGTMSGAFGMGALSFPKFIGTGNSTMIMLSQSRLNGDNAAYLVSLAGIEPIRGSLDEGEFGTKFKLDQKRRDMSVREAVERYAKWMRVPVLYRENDENGEEVFNEDWGDRRLYDEYKGKRWANHFIKRGCFEAFASPDATGKTLLLSMEIERNGKKEGKAPYPFDVRLLDESGKIVESSNGNEGLIPVTRPDYNQMLLNARPNSITSSLLSNQDVTAYETTGDEYDYAIEEHVLETEEALPIAEYVPLDEGSDQLLGDEVVIIGPNEGRTVVSGHEWNDLPKGRAAQFVPEDELEPYDLETKEGDLRLPEPTTDRSSLQSNDVFWKYIANYFAKQYNDSIDEYTIMLQKTTDPMNAIEEMSANTVATMTEELNNAR